MRVEGSVGTGSCGGARRTERVHGLRPRTRRMTRGKTQQIRQGRKDERRNRGNEKRGLGVRWGHRRYGRESRVELGGGDDESFEGSDVADLFFEPLMFSSKLLLLLRKFLPAR